MSSLESMRHELNKLKERVGSRPAPPFGNFSFKFYLFTEQEQERAAALQAKILETGTLEHLTRPELYEMRLLSRLERSLELEDLAEMEHCRQRLHEDRNELLKTFLAIDESTIPDFHHAPTVIDHQGLAKRLYALNFRIDRGSVADKVAEQLTGDNIETMHIWLETDFPVLSAL